MTRIRKIPGGSVDLDRMPPRPEGYDEGTLDHEVGQLIEQAQRVAYQTCDAARTQTQADFKGIRRESAILEAFEDYFCARWGREAKPKSGPRVSTCLAMSPAGEWWTVTMHDGEPHSARHHSGHVLERVHRDTFVRWGSDDPMEVLDAVTKLWRPT